MLRHSRPDFDDAAELESLKAKVQVRYGLRMPEEEMRKFLDDIERAFHAPKCEKHQSVPLKEKQSAAARM